MVKTLDTLKNMKDLVYVIKVTTSHTHQKNPVSHRISVWNLKSQRNIKLKPELWPTLRGNFHLEPKKSSEKQYLALFIP